MYFPIVCIACTILITYSCLYAYMSYLYFVDATLSYSWLSSHHAVAMHSLLNSVNRLLFAFWSCICICIRLPASTWYCTTVRVRMHMHTTSDFPSIRSLFILLEPEKMMQKYLLLLSLAVASQSFVIQPPTKVTSAAALFSTTQSISDNLASALKKASKTLAVVLEYDGPSNASPGDLSTVSMQLRKCNAVALVTSDLAAAAAFVEEQATAKGNFPGPCPVIYTGDDVEGAVKAGVSAVIVEGNKVVDGTDVICKVSSPAEAEAVSGGAYLVDADSESVQEILAAIPTGSVVLASMKAMQNDNTEFQRGKELRELGVTAILLEKACVGDAEDILYATFVINGLTKKKSSTFNMSGLTGSTNGHFGGVATSMSTTWLRVKRSSSSE